MKSKESLKVEFVFICGMINKKIVKNADYY